MSRRLDKALKRWRNAGPLENESMKLLLDVKEASMRQQPDDSIWAAFVRSLTDKQQSALAGVIDLVGRDGILSG